MRRSVGFRVGAMVALGLAVLGTALPASASAPEDSAPANPLAAAADLLGSAASSISTLGQQTLDNVQQGVQTTLDQTSVAALGPCSGTGALNSGKDGRVTIALYGSDYRGNTKRTHYIGERTDVIIVATLRGNDRVVAVSIPRDTVQFPKAGGGTWGGTRVNAIYQAYRKNGLYYKKVDCSALKSLTKDVAAALQTEIDYYAMVRMETFKALVDKVGGVPTDIHAKIVDSYYGHHGVWFPEQNNYKLKGDPKCYGWKSSSPPCKSALAYVRSRHGTVGSGSNNDYRRADRQRQFIFETTQWVRGKSEAFITGSLTPAIQDKVWTNVPKSASTILQIYNLLDGISMSNFDQVVFGPSTWAEPSGGQYTYKLKLDKVRAWINEHFGS
ncbi:MAG: LCP family protein [Chloroflexota bacterium]